MVEKIKLRIPVKVIAYTCTASHKRRLIDLIVQPVSGGKVAILGMEIPMSQDKFILYILLKYHHFT